MAAMRTASPRTDKWSDIVDAVSSVADLDKTARPTRAFLRPRAVKTPADRLRLALMDGAEALSLCRCAMSRPKPAS
jgi:hypothetical protein